MLRDKVIEIFIKVDDFCKEIQPVMEEKLIEDKKLGKRNRKAGLCESELISLMILFHAGQFKQSKVLLYVLCIAASDRLVSGAAIV